MTLLSPTAGAFGGKIFVDTNDRDEDPFELSVMGLVSAVTPTLALGQVVVDNDNLDVPVTFVATGEFRYQHRDTRYVDNDYRYSNTANSGSTARWTLNVASTRGPRTFQIAATWAGGENRATNAPFRVYAADGTTLLGGPFRINQNPAPNDFEDLDVMWERLGNVMLPGGATSLIVELGTDWINGYVLADAIWAGLSTTPEIQVFDGGTELTDEVSAINLGYTELQPASPVTKTFTVWNTGGVDLKLFEPISLPQGFSLVQSFGTTTVPAGSSTTFTVAVDAGAPGPVGGEISFATSDSDENPFEFNISAQVGVQIVDNDNAGSRLGAREPASVHVLQQPAVLRRRRAVPQRGQPAATGWTGNSPA